MAYALVTGGSSGMGLEYCRQLARRGYDIIMVSNRQDQLDEAAPALSGESGVKVIPLFLDLSDPAAASLLLEKVDAMDAFPEIMVHNAGMFFFLELNPELLPKAEAMVRLHVGFVTSSVVLFGERMKQRGSGRMLLVSSMAARIPAPGISVYAASKAYLRSFGESMYYELRPYGVTVTTVCPAAIDTPLYGLSDKMRLWGRRLGLIHTPAWLVRRALRALMRGRCRVSPSLINGLVPALVSLLPPPFESWIWKKLKPRLGKGAKSRTQAAGA